MEEQLNPLAVTHLLQHTLRSLCTSDSSQWVYAVFWRILPRNYPPPKWDLQGGAFDRTRGNRRNWILAWEDGFCNFAASACEQSYGECETKALQPELFFKMSHDIYNYGEGMIGKVAADHSHKWVLKEAQEQEANLLSSWNNPADSQPRTWEAQFQSGIKTIALIAVREGVVQLGSMKKVVEDLSYVVLLRRKFGYLESIPGVLLPHPSSSAFPACASGLDSWPGGPAGLVPPMEFYDPYNNPVRIMPSMSSLEALLSKLPSVGPSPSGSSSSQGQYDVPVFVPGQRSVPVVAKEEVEDEYGQERVMDIGGEASSSMSYYVNVAKHSEDF
ncbi:Serine/threonine-protein kinase WNK (With No Lysine)-like protein [Rhynchospora pubera]|uniref:Serine/threonine-protein kinase WNK (With No Lysine)-like protein n=1 Tax=Rhynchospora pubera TaxID=906938 RepID=A0AAV8HFE8_9POAL|nr:Serine/threonine-protein kinase WNK (With No Lysine)-like protein [Rhynchospora pubera]